MAWGAVVQLRSFSRAGELVSSPWKELTRSGPGLGWVGPDPKEEGDPLCLGGQASSSCLSRKG